MKLLVSASHLQRKRIGDHSVDEENLRWVLLSRVMADHSQKAQKGGGGGLQFCRA